MGANCFPVYGIGDISIAILGLILWDHYCLSGVYNCHSEIYHTKFTLVTCIVDSNIAPSYLVNS